MRMIRKMKYGLLSLIIIATVAAFYCNDSQDYHDVQVKPEVGASGKDTSQKFVKNHQVVQPHRHHQKKSDAKVAPNDAVTKLMNEVHALGWIVYSARSDQGDWDLFLSRPDGSDRRNITHTPNSNEAAPQFSRDGKKLLYRKMPLKERISGNEYGAQGVLVIANSDGTNPKIQGKTGEYSWASWSPDGKQIACLSIKGVSIIELSTMKILQTLPRKGYFQQMTWSPDGKHFSGVTNAHGTGWTVAQLNISGTHSTPVSKFQCCTPDWFPDSKKLIFSNRPPKQAGDRGKGWTQLWMSDAQGKSRHLVYGEDGRHVYGGKISPDGKYVIFTGNMKEDGDPSNNGAPMALMRLADAPMVGGRSIELRKLYPKAKREPVLELPAGWEPDWTATNLSKNAVSIKSSSPPQRKEITNPVTLLAHELKTQGWIAYATPSGKGDWDIFKMRPDGSSRINLTKSRKYNEAGVRFSPDGQRILYYRMPLNELVSARQYATNELVVAGSEGKNPVSHGTGYHWASWGPEGKRIACLGKKKIKIIDLKTHQVLQELPRNGVVWQLTWSPDGKSLVGTANGLGQFWNIGCIGFNKSNIIRVSESDRYNCTPDWMFDSQRILYARGIVPKVGGWAELWVANRQGNERRMLYAETSRHIYGGCASPDGKYLAFSRSVSDQGSDENQGFQISIIRWKDTPMIGDESVKLIDQYPKASHGPRLDLGEGWEPHWTFSELKPVSK